MGKTRRKVLSGIATGTAGLIGATASTASTPSARDQIASAYKEAYGKSSDSVAEMLLALDERISGNPYREAYDGPIPTHENDVVTDILGVPADPDTLIDEDAPCVAEYADALDDDAIRGQDGTLDFEGKSLPDYRSGQEQFGRTHVREPCEYLVDDREGDCIDYAVAMASIMEHLGYSSRVVTGAFRYPDGDAAMHAVTETQIGNDVYVFDTINTPEYRRRDSYEDGKTVGQWAPVTMFGTDTAYQFYDPDW